MAVTSRPQTRQTKAPLQQSALRRLALSSSSPLAPAAPLPHTPFFPVSFLLSPFPLSPLPPPPAACDVTQRPSLLGRWWQRDMVLTLRP
eukprot:1922927-Rhodomonas_salina.1